MNTQKLNTIIAYQAIARTEKTYNQLSQEQRKIIDEQFIKGSHTPKEWVKLISKIVQYDTLADEARRFKIDRPVPTRDALLILGVVVSLLSAIQLGAYLMASVGLAAYLAGVFLYFFLPPGKKVLAREEKQRLMAKKYSRILFDYSDLPNHFRKFILPLIKELANLMQDDEKLRLNVNLGPKKESDHKFEREDIPTNENYDAPKDYVYEETEFYNYPLMNIRAKLSDGSILMFNIEDLIRNRRFVKKIYIEDDDQEEIWKGTMRISYHLQVLLYKKCYDLATKHTEKIGNFMVDDTENAVLDLKSQDNEFYLSYLDGGDAHILTLQASTITQLQRYYYFNDFEIDEELYYIPDIDFFKRLMRIIKHQVKPIKQKNTSDKVSSEEQ